MKKRHNSRFGRRALLGGTSAGLMLQALATGIPAKVLLDPLSASANTPMTGRVLLMVCSRDGDPINCNVPGTYIPGIDHAADPLMAETAFNLGSTAVTGAQVWANLPQTTLDRTLFFHHRTATPVHGDQPRVQRMMDNTETNDMLVSLIARETAPLLGTTQTAPLTLGASAGGELISTEGRLLPNVAPLSVKQALAGDVGVLKELTDIRDQAVDDLYALYKQKGTKQQRALLDSWVKSRDDVRNISEALTGRLQTIDGNDELNQVRTAAVLTAMKIAPVITVHVNFGADNHNDATLATEVSRHVSGLNALQTLMDDLDQLRTEGHLPHEFVVATFNVFGRTLKRNAVGGRDHNQNHHTMVCMGDCVAPGVIGGLHEVNNKFSARGINSTTGAADDAGDIAFEDTLFAAGKTLAALAGVDSDRIDEMIPGGPTAKIVQSALG